MEIPPPGPHPAQLAEEDFLKQCEFSAQRRSGPGGQHRNKTDSGVVIRHLPTGLETEACERRSKIENQRQAVWRLRLLLALEVRTDPDSPSPLWKSRCSQGRVAVNPEHRDFPAMLAEALDVLDLKKYHVPAAAELLGCTATQLVKLLKQEPKALGLVNERRRRLGLKPLQ